MLDVLRSALAFLVVLGVLVFVHELGHYLAARWRGVHVEVFSIGFGPAIATWRDRVGTVWKLAWLPLGGYVKLHGQERAGGRASRRAFVAEPGSPRPRTVPRSRRVFHEKSVGARRWLSLPGRSPISCWRWCCSRCCSPPPAARSSCRSPATSCPTAPPRAPGSQADDRILSIAGDADHELRGHPADHHRASGRDAGASRPARRQDAGPAGA